MGRWWRYKWITFHPSLTAWKEHRDRYQQDMEKLESENMELRRKLGEAKRDIDAYKRLFNGESHA